MKTDKMEVNLRHWNDQQAVLRRLLMKDRNYREAIPVFMSQHKVMHTAKLYAGVHWSFHDQVLSGLADEQMRLVPKGCSHSVAWAIWHITRIEDVTMNLLLAGSPQILFSGNWLGKLQIAGVGVGNELTSAESVLLSETINLKALFAYRLAVGKRTQSLAPHLEPAVLGERPAPERLQRVVQEGAVSDKVSWLLKYWGRNASANLLLMPATRHCLVHLNEISRMLPKLRRLQES
jgi:hypothetical protein